MIKPSRIEQIFELLHDRRPKVLVIGDLMVDEYVQGTARSISPEAPIPVVNRKDTTVVLGGAANVASNARALGAEVKMVGIVGCDYWAGTVMKMLHDKDIESDLYWASGCKTTLKTRYVADGQQLLRLDNENLTERAPDGYVDFIKQNYEAWLQWADVVILSDYLKGAVDKRIVPFFTARCDESCRPNVFVDPKGTDWKKYNNATLIKPNINEAKEYIGTRDSKWAEKNIHGLVDDLTHEYVLLTKGSDGMTLISEDGVDDFKATTKKVFDVTGAGDTVIATMAVIYALPNITMNEAVGIANLAAGVVVGKPGTSVVRTSEIRKAIHHEEVSKVLFRNRAYSVIGDLSKDTQVVFTNGCFDILHAGHVHSLREAKQHGDVLIVGINSDESVTRLKGPSRPIISQTERAHLIAALECVDYVVIFNEDTPEELIKELKPDVLVKGGDYEKSDIAGADFVEANGGRVEIINLVDNLSTSTIVEKIKSDK